MAGAPYAVAENADQFVIYTLNRKSDTSPIVGEHLPTGTIVYWTVAGECTEQPRFAKAKLHMIPRDYTGVDNPVHVGDVLFNPASATHYTVGCASPIPAGLVRPILPPTSIALPEWEALYHKMPDLEHLLYKDAWHIAEYAIRHALTMGYVQLP